MPDIAAGPAGSGATPAEEPKPVLLWRTGRFERHGPRRHDNRQRPGRRPEGAEGGDQRPGGRPQFQGRRDGKDGGRQKFGGDRNKGGPGGEGGRPNFRKGKPRDGEDRAAKPAFQSRPREDRAGKIDPLSPFAKLAALRDQLKK